MTSATTIAQCHVRTVNAIMISSVRINAVKEIDTMWINSSSNNNTAPNNRIPPKMDNMIIRIFKYGFRYAQIMLYCNTVSSVDYSNIP